jgi:actin-related protein
MFQDLTSLVLDIGTFQARIGYGGDEAPKVVAPSFVVSQAAMEESERKMLAGKKYLCLDRTDLEIESIFRHKGEGQAFQIDEDKYSQFVDFLLTD